MNDNVIVKVEKLSKAYRIGLQDQKHDTLGAAIASWVKSPLQNFKRLKNLSRIDASKDDKDVFWALKDVDFEVKRGDVFGIIGKNGAGKSTLLKILSRITEPSSGRVEIFGRVASLLEVGTGFNPELTGRENVYLNGTILGMTKREIENKFDQILEFSGIEKFIDTPVKRYSSGMKMRLAFAVAAHLDPEILIIDEVLAVGDAEFQKKCLGKMKDISEGEGRTVFFVSHNMAAVQSLCTHGLVLNNGRVTYFGNIQGAVNSYLHQFVNENRKVSYSLQHAPGNDFAKLLSASVKGFDKGEDDVIRAGESIEFSFCYEILKKENATLDITFHLIDEMGILVFVGSTSFSEACKGKYANEDHTIARCVIPANLMNEGTYSISKLLLVKDRGYVALSLGDIIQFDVMPEVSSELGWMGKKEGTVKPELNWTIIKK